MYYLGYKPIVTNEFLAENKRMKAIDDFFVDAPSDIYKLPPHVWDKMRVCVSGIKKDGINILKDPQAAFAINEWLRFDEIFATAKYIWCRRDPLMSG
jgi:hypothetical protein